MPTATETATPTVTATSTSTPSPTAATATPTPTYVQVIPGSRGIVEAVRAAQPGNVVVVPAGIYEAVTLTESDVHGPITLLADTTGFYTGGAEGAVIISGRGRTTALQLTGVYDLLVDGFTITNGTTAGIEIRDGAGNTVADCIVRDNQSDGVRLVQSESNLVFNNLIYNNQRAGISATGVSDLQIINNTIYGNGTQGINIGDSLFPSDTIYIRNNIIMQNKAHGIVIDATTTGFDSNYNLNNDGYGENTPAGSKDFQGNPFFNNPGTDNGFRLPPTSDFCAGGSIAMDAGDPATDPDLASILGEMTTQTDNKWDCIGSGCCPPGCVPGGDPATGAPDCSVIGRVDLGYHYMAP